MYVGRDLGAGLNSGHYIAIEPSRGQRLSVASGRGLFRFQETASLFPAD